MTVLYKLAAEQLSKQHHYDFGLRALKSVLVMAGALKRGSPGMPEQLVLMRALRDMNLPKFVYDDVPLFLGLVEDLFPGLDCPRVRYPRLNDEIEAELAAAGYQVLTAPGDQVDKVVQLYEVMLTRHTTMVVGQTGGGKSVILQALARAQVRFAGGFSCPMVGSFVVLFSAALPSASVELEPTQSLKLQTKQNAPGPPGPQDDPQRPQPQGHQRRGAIRRAGQGHPRLDGRAALQHLPGGEQAAAARPRRGAVHRAGW